MKKKQDKKKIVYLILIVSYIVFIFLLTFQEKDKTEALSNRVIVLINSMGIHIYAHSLRSLVHIPLYCVLGGLIYCLVKRMCWPCYFTLIIGGIIGLIDETVKIFIPTREFEFMDIIRDILGILIGIVIVSMFRKRTLKKFPKAQVNNG